MSAQFDLLTAVTQGDAQAVASALAAGVAPDLRDAVGWTPLMWAAGAGDIANVRQLLDAGADVFASDADGRTAYGVAVAARRKDVAFLLAQAERATGLPDVRGSSERHAHRPYCRAYPVDVLRRFARWDEAFAAQAVNGAAADSPDHISPAGTEILFLHRNLRVTRTVFEDDPAVFDGNAADWAAFCHSELAFKPVDDFDWISAFDRFE